MKHILILFLVANFSLAAFAQQFRGINRDGIYPDKNLLDQWPESGPALVSTFEGMGLGYSSPSITEKGIFIPGMIDSTGYLFHYDFSGKLIWKTECGSEWTYKYLGARSTPTIEGNKLFYSGSMGDAYCVNTENGAIIWHVNIFEKYKGRNNKWGYTESPLLFNDLVILTPGGDDYSIVALSKKSGDLVWSIKLDGDFNAYCSPDIFVHNGKKFGIVNLSKKIVLFDPVDGKVYITHPLTTPQLNHSTVPVYLNGNLFYASGYNEGSVLFKINDEQKRLDTLCVNPIFDSKLSGVINYNGLLYGTSDKKKQWMALNPKTCETVMETRVPEAGSFLLADDKFYIYTEKGKVALAKPNEKGFVQVSQFQIPATEVTLSFAHPVMHNGVLYVRYNNTMWGYKVSK